METKFKKGDLVNLYRNKQVRADNIEVVAVVENPPHKKESAGEFKNNSKLIQTYIIEYEFGWTPNSIRKTKYNLDENKKYLFVSESELTLMTD